MERVNNVRHWCDLSGGVRNRFSAEERVELCKRLRVHFDVAMEMYQNNPLVVDVDGTSYVLFRKNGRVRVGLK